MLSPFFSKLQTIQLQLETIEDTVLVALLNEFFHKSDFTLGTLILSCRVTNTTIYKSEIFSSMKSLNMVNGKIEMEHIDSAQWGSQIVKTQLKNLPQKNIREK